MKKEKLQLSPKLQDVQDYWDEFVNDIEVSQHKIGSKEFFNELAQYRYKKLAYLLKMVSFPKYRGKKVLEIGCGIGLDSVQFARAGADLTAIDLAPNAIKLAKHNLELNGLKASLVKMNAENLKFKDNYFDVVYSHGVLHHTPNPQKAINEVFRVLKPGGEAIIMLYKKNSWMHLLSRIKGVHVEHEEKEAPIIYFFSCYEAQQLFAKFENLIILVERFPFSTPKYSGVKAFCYNYFIVPIFQVLPKALIKPLGAHLMIWAYKP